MLSKEAVTEVDKGFISRGFLNDNGLEELQKAAGYPDTLRTSEIDANAGGVQELGRLWRSRVALEISQFGRTPKAAQEIASKFVNSVAAARGTVEDGPTGTVLKVMPEVGAFNGPPPRTPEQHKAMQVTGLFNAMLAGTPGVPDLKAIAKWSKSDYKWGLLTDNSVLGQYQSGTLPYLVTDPDGVDSVLNVPGTWSGMERLVNKAKERGVNPLQWGSTLSFAQAFNEAYQDALSGTKSTSRVIDAVSDQMFSPVVPSRPGTPVTLDAILDRLKVTAPTVNPVTLK